MWRWIAAAVVALAVGALGAESYARLATPYYTAVARWIAQDRPWEIGSVSVVPGRNGSEHIVRLDGTVSRTQGDPFPAARLVGKLQVATVVQVPLIFWTLLLMWPAGSWSQRVARLALGLPVFLCLEAITTVCQLLNPLAYASAVLAGDESASLTWWERWSRFLESGGRVVVSLLAAMIPIVLIQRVSRPSGSTSLHANRPS